MKMGMPQERKPRDSQDDQDKKAEQLGTFRVFSYGGDGKVLEDSMAELPMIAIAADKLTGEPVALFRNPYGDIPARWNADKRVWVADPD